MHRLLPVLPLLLMLALLEPARAQDDSRWDDRFGPAGVYNPKSDIDIYSNPAWTVDAIVSLGNRIYVGGRFLSASGVPAAGIACWDGERWSSLPGIIRGDVHALVIGPDGYLYAGGTFVIPVGSDTLRSIARWDGVKWNRVGSDLRYYDFDIPAKITSLAVDGNNLYVAGPEFSHAGSTPVVGLARWNGTRWSSMGNQPTGTIHTVAAGGGRVYIGGHNVFAGDTYTHLAMWDGTTWSALATTMSDAGNRATVYSLLLANSRLFVGGHFTTIDGVPAQGIAEWDGTRWSALGDGLQYGGVRPNSGVVRTMAAMGDDLYVGGSFHLAGSGVEVNGLARWSGSYWSAVGQGIRGVAPHVSGKVVKAILPFNGSLVVGGNFESVGSGLETNGIAIWNPASEWSALRGGSAGALYAIAGDGRQVFVGGDTTTAGGVRVTHVGAIGDTTTLPLLEINGAVNALAWSDGVLYAGGRFTAAGNTRPGAIARWNGEFWTVLQDGGSNGVDGEIDAIAIDGRDLYAGGEFLSAGAGRAARNIARWDGTRWHSLGDGLDGRVNAIALYRGRVYAGGDFSTADGRRGLAVWDGTSWSNGVDGGVAGVVHALAVSGERLIVGGDLESVGEIPAPGIAVFDGEVWSPLGGGIHGIVRAIAVDRDEIYIGGEFSSAGEEPADNVALWDGSSWHALGSGIDGRVNGIGITSSGIYFVGSFSVSGGKPAYNVARWLRGTSSVPVAPLAMIASTAYPNPFSTATTIAFSLPAPAETRLEILDLQGCVVATLVDASLSAGSRSYRWEPDEGVAAGLYLYRLRSGSTIANGKILLEEHAGR